MTFSATVSDITKDINDEGELEDLSTFALSSVPEGVSVYEITGPLYFGAAYKFREALAVVDKPPKVIIIRMRNVPVVDSTGERTLNDVMTMFRKKGTKFILSGLQSQAKATLERSGLLERVGEGDVTPTYDDALLRARVLLKEMAKKA